MTNHGDRLPIMQPNSVEYLGVTDNFVVPHDRFIKAAEDLKNPIYGSQAGENAILFRMNGRCSPHARIDGCLGGGIAGGTIFEECSLQDFSDAATVPIQCAISGEKVGG